jgi:beta-syntrophin
MNLINFVFLFISFQGRPCQFLIHLDRGFSLVDSSAGVVLWTYPFDKLRGSADDGNRLLLLDFASEDGEIVSILIRIECFRHNL